jgi:hypothetical protein
VWLEKHDWPRQSERCDLFGTGAPEASAWVALTVIVQQNRGYADRYMRQSARDNRQGSVEWKPPMKTTRSGLKRGAKRMSVPLNSRVRLSTFAYPCVTLPLIARISAVARGP